MKYKLMEKGSVPRGKPSMPENLSYVKSRLKGWPIHKRCWDSGRYGGLTIKMAPVLHPSLHILLAKSGFSSFHKEVVSFPAPWIRASNKMIPKYPCVSSKPRSPKALCASTFSPTPEPLPGEQAWGTRGAELSTVVPTEAPDVWQCPANISRAAQPASSRQHSHEQGPLGPTLIPTVKLGSKITMSLSFAVICYATLLWH